MTQKPLWRQAVESLDGQVGGRLEQIVRNENFGIAVGLLMRARRESGAVAGRVTTTLLHAVNLPARSDLDRVLRHLASLEREVLALSDRTNSAGRAAPGGTDEAPTS